MYRLYINGGACQWTRETEKELKDYIKTVNKADRKMGRPLGKYEIKKEGE